MFIASRIVLGPKLLMSDHTDCIKFNSDFKSNISHHSRHASGLTFTFMMICFRIEAFYGRVALWESDTAIETSTGRGANGPCRAAITLSNEKNTAKLDGVHRSQNVETYNVITFYVIAQK